VFISLEERTYIANDIKADLLLSIHANSSPYPAVRGSETYYLDCAGSTEVMEVSARENATAREKVSDRLELMKIGLDEKKDGGIKDFCRRHSGLSQPVSRALGQQRAEPAGESRAVCGLGWSEYAIGANRRL